MINKRAQAQIITTVLIILLVLAAIVIVWQVVSGTIEGGGEQIQSQSGCIGVSMEVTDIVTTSGSESITVRRGQGETETKVTDCKVFVDGQLAGTCNGASGCSYSESSPMNPLDTCVVDSLSPAPTASSTVSVAAQVGNTVCAASADVLASDF